MESDLKDVIASLVARRKAIDSALLALRGPESSVTESKAEQPAAPRKRRARRKSRLTPEGRRRLAEAMRKRWAVKRTAAQAKKAARKRKAA